jgi:cytochrome c peroxidase
LSAVPLSRDALWRSLFTRPEVTKPAALDSARIELGKLLFQDVRLSGGLTRSCASCHMPERAFTDGLARARGLDGLPLNRNTPTLYNVGWGTSFFWDGRAPTLEAQARVPLTSPAEMAGQFAQIVERLGTDREMASRFRHAFPDEPAITDRAIVAALASYERSLSSPETAFDRWVAGDDAALDDFKKQGFTIFVGKGGCVACHRGWRFTDDEFHDIGLKSDDPGRGAVAGGVSGVAQFKTPSLRELMHTAPYMHDGSMPTLEAVVDHYSGGLQHRPSLDINIVTGLTLDDAEKRALVAFLKSLSSD